jgi:hypothetical protein
VRLASVACAGRITCCTRPYTEEATVNESEKERRVVPEKRHRDEPEDTRLRPGGSSLVNPKASVPKSPDEVVSIEGDA